jgi:hypothetical protein
LSAKELKLSGKVSIFMSFLNLAIEIQIFPS